MPTDPSSSAARLTSAEEANALPIGSVIVMHGPGCGEPVPHPGLTWFRIERGWINSFGSEVPARPDWPYIGQLGGPFAVTAAFRAEIMTPSQQPAHNEATEAES